MRPLSVKALFLKIDERNRIGNSYVDARVPFAI
jgi:hypothetical protein